MTVAMFLWSEVSEYSIKILNELYGKQNIVRKKEMEWIVSGIFYVLLVSFKNRSLL